MSAFQNSAVVSCDCSWLFLTESKNMNMIQRSRLSPGISKYWCTFLAQKCKTRVDLIQDVCQFCLQGYIVSTTICWCWVKLHVTTTLFITWCLFLRAWLHMRREEKPTRCHWMVYCTYDMLNMFQALLCPSSGARDYMCVITAFGVQCLVAGCRGSNAGQPAMCPGRGMLHD